MLCGGCHLRLANLGSSRSAVRWGTSASLTSLGLHNSASDCLRLARIHSSSSSRNCAVMPLGARRTVLGLVHGAGHFGQKRTLQVLRRSYFWFGMAKDAQYWCRSCLVCQKAKAPNQARVPIQEFKMEGIGPGYLVAMDIGTLPWADQKFRYFLCIVDVFTRYMELIPLQVSSVLSARVPVWLDLSRARCT